MILLFFVITLTTFLFSSFTVSNKLLTINRVVMNTPKEIFESSIPILEVSKEDLYFDKNNLQERLKNYYDSNLEKVFPDYTMELYYYNQNDKSICTSDKCDAVEVTVSGNYIFSFNYSRSISYEIRKGAMYGVE